MTEDIFHVFGAAPLPPEDVKRLRGHIEELCAQHEVIWDEDENVHVLLGAEGNFDARSILTPPLESEIVYWAAIHEIGHLVLKLRTFDDDGNVLFQNELDVWKWALDEAIITPGADAGAGIFGAFLSHADQPPPPPELRTELRQALDAEGGEPMRYKS